MSECEFLTQQYKIVIKKMPQHKNECSQLAQFGSISGTSRAGEKVIVQSADHVVEENHLLRF